jgi:hypothetical protein
MLFKRKRFGVAIKCDITSSYIWLPERDFYLSNLVNINKIAKYLASEQSLGSSPSLNYAIFLLPVGSKEIQGNWLHYNMKFKRHNVTFSPAWYLATKT